MLLPDKIALILSGRSSRLLNSGVFNHIASRKLILFIQGRTSTPHIDGLPRLHGVPVLIRFPLG
jgi:hypothetical protein